MRVLVTGSRTWDVADSLEVAFDDLAQRLNVPMIRDDDGHALDWDWRAVRLTIVHGAAPEGGDALADMYARTHMVPVERCPANWHPNGRFDRTAGFKRNAEMVATKPDRVIGLVDRCAKPEHQSSPHGSHGAMHTLYLARDNRLPARIFYRGFSLEEPLVHWAEHVVEVAS